MESRTLLIMHDLWLWYVSMRHNAQGDQGGYVPNSGAHSRWWVHFFKLEIKLVLIPTCRMGVKIFRLNQISTWYWYQLAPNVNMTDENWRCAWLRYVNISTIRDLSLDPPPPIFHLTQLADSQAVCYIILASPHLKTVPHVCIDNLEIYIHINQHTHIIFDIFIEIAISDCRQCTPRILLPFSSRPHLISPGETLYQSWHRYK